MHNVNKFTDNNLKQFQTTNRSNSTEFSLVFPYCMKDNCENEQENTIQSDEETKREQKLGFPASITAVHTAKDNVNGL